MNRALDYARQEGIPYLARMDADDLSHPQRLEIQLALLEERPGAAACSANCIYIDADRGTAIGTSTVSAAPWLVRWEVLHGLRGLIQGACLFRSAALAEAGGYRPQFRRAEESDVFMRLAERFELANAREYLYQIRLRPDSLSMGDVHSNTLYQFYALDCSIRRRQGRPERDFAAFQADPGPGMRWRIWREERVLRLWRAGMGRGGTGRRLLAALLDPRRGVVRLLRRLDVG
jgi:glycosyltransferase involved in cell wall biosynthesis